MSPLRRGSTWSSANHSRAVSPSDTFRGLSPEDRFRNSSTPSFSGLAEAQQYKRNSRRFSLQSLQQKALPAAPLHAAAAGHTTTTFLSPTADDDFAKRSSRRLSLQTFGFARSSASTGTSTPLTALPRLGGGGAPSSALSSGTTTPYRPHAPNSGTSTPSQRPLASHPPDAAAGGKDGILIEEVISLSPATRTPGTTQTFRRSRGSRNSLLLSAAAGGPGPNTDRAPLHALDENTVERLDVYRPTQQQQQRRRADSSSASASASKRHSLQYPPQASVGGPLQAHHRHYQGPLVPGPGSPYFGQKVSQFELIANNIENAFIAMR